MRRGEIRVVHGRITGRDQPALIISNDALNESGATGWVTTAPVDVSGAAPDLLVTVPILSPVVGVVRLDKVTSVAKARVGELIGRLDQDQMDAVAIGLRAALDL